MTNCLNDAKKAYGDAFEDHEIEDVYTSLNKAKENALAEGSNVYDEIKNASSAAIHTREFQLKAKKIQHATNVKAFYDSMMRVKALKYRNNPVQEGLFGKLTGNTRHEEGQVNARNSTFLKADQAQKRFTGNFYKELRKNNLESIWNSKEFEPQIVDALYKSRRGENIADPRFEKMAQIVTKYNNILEGEYNKLGIFTPQLEDRIAPHAWDSQKLSKLTSEELRSAGGDSRKQFEIAFQKWKGFVYPSEDGSLFDNDRTFKDNKTDAQRETFLKNAFDTLVNHGKVGQEGVNFANRILKERVLHAKNGDSLIKINDKYGSGAIQDSIVNEMSSGFRRVAIMKDWGINPQTTLNNVLKTVEKDPDLKFRTGKQNDIKIITRLMNNLTGSVRSNPSSINTITSNIVSAMNITKLGAVTPAVAFIDAANMAHELSTIVGGSGLGAAKESVENMLYGASQEDRKQIADLLGIYHSHQMGSIARFYNDDLSSAAVISRAERYMFKLNGLDRWDFSVRTAMAGVLSRFLAFSRNKSFDSLEGSLQKRLSEYGIGQHEWDAIRKSGTTVSGKKLYITPDSIHEPKNDENVKSILTTRGQRVTSNNIQSVKEELESKMRMFFQDSADKVIQNPDLRSMDLARFTASKDHWAYPLARLASQFKSFGISLYRNKVQRLMYGGGAQSLKEALLPNWNILPQRLQGKADYLQNARYAAYAMPALIATQIAKSLVKGQAPPNPADPKLWVKASLELIPFMSDLADVDTRSTTQMLGSLAKNIAGPGLGTVAQGGVLAGDLVRDTFRNKNKGKGYTSSEKAALSLGYGLVPKLPFASWAFKNMIYDHIQNSIDPNSRQRALDRMKQEQNSTSLF